MPSVTTQIGTLRGWMVSAVNQRQISYDIIYMQNQTKKDTNGLTKQKQAHRLGE